MTGPSDHLQCYLLTFLHSVEHECKVRSVLHSETYTYYKRCNMLLCYPALFVTSLCGSTFVTNNSGYLFVLMLTLRSPYLTSSPVVCLLYVYYPRLISQISLINIYIHQENFRSIHYFRCKQGPQFPHSEYIEIRAFYIIFCVLMSQYMSLLVIQPKQ